ncbi:hypothetical protein K504DRAFT_499125 [Pleomassaria siparia CBS 279.74]|uniref:Uncharacterized protein n=1 Tax=Pleomassaria siparia CBS 279.74 TaxID=1314801 RepID=A0A6G1KGN4_9PLEO|nr:hypothetical protein K504DRAFT_499125 [Pleomassaria siparia CBS 279.74]
MLLRARVPTFFVYEYPGNDVRLTRNTGVKMVFLWNGVSKRVHRPLKVFFFGPKANEVVIVGTVEYWLDDGSYVKKGMAPYTKYQRKFDTDGIEMSSLQVWLTG